MSGIIISTFPGVYKRYISDKVYKYIDLNSRDFHWMKNQDGEKVNNPDFPENYINCILENLEKQDMVFVPLADMKTLDDAGLRYLLVYPSKSIKTDWLENIKSWIVSDSAKMLVDELDKNWNKIIKNIENTYTSNCIKIEILNSFVQLESIIDNHFDTLKQIINMPEIYSGFDTKFSVSFPSNNISMVDISHASIKTRNKKEYKNLIKGEEIMTKKIFLSVPMDDHSETYINKAFSIMKDSLKALFNNEELMFVTNYLSDEYLTETVTKGTNKIAYRLSEAAVKISECDYVVFHPDWETSQDCKIEMAICKRADIRTIIIGDDFDTFTVDLKCNSYADEIFKPENSELLSYLKEIRRDTKGKSLINAIPVAMADLPQCVVNHMIQLSEEDNFSNVTTWVASKIKLIDEREKK